VETSGGRVIVKFNAGTSSGTATITATSGGATGTSATGGTAGATTPSNAVRIAIGAAAGITFAEEVKMYAFQQGLFVIAQSGETVKILNDAKFTPKVWNAD
jgi:hypothetical protein